MLTLREEPAAGLEVRTKRLPDMVPVLLNMLRQPGPDMTASMGIMTASTGAVTPGSTCTIWLPWLSMTVGRSESGGRLLCLDTLPTEERRRCTARNALHNAKQKVSAGLLESNERTFSLIAGKHQVLDQYTSVINLCLLQSLTEVQQADVKCNCRQKRSCDFTSRFGIGNMVLLSSVSPALPLPLRWQHEGLYQGKSFV